MGGARHTPALPQGAANICSVGVAAALAAGHLTEALIYASDLSPGEPSQEVSSQILSASPSWIR